MCHEAQIEATIDDRLPEESRIVEPDRVRDLHARIAVLQLIVLGQEEELRELRREVAGLPTRDGLHRAHNRGARS